MRRRGRRCKVGSRARRRASPLRLRPAPRPGTVAEAPAGVEVATTAALRRGRHFKPASQRANG